MLIICFKLNTASCSSGRLLLFGETAVKRTGLIMAHPSIAKVSYDLVRSKSILSAHVRSNRVNYNLALPNADVELEGIKSWPTSLVYNQGNIGSCTANAVAFILRYLSVRNSDTPSNFLDNPQRLDCSRLYHYYNTRYEEGNITKNPKNVLVDKGASLEGAIIALDKYGACPEEFSEKTDLGRGFSYGGWPYDIKKFKIQPNPESYRFSLDVNYGGINADSRVNPYGLVSKNLRYSDLCSAYISGSRLNTEDEKRYLVNEFRVKIGSNIPVYFGTLLGKGMLTLQVGGFVPMPALDKSFKPIGGHAIAIVGHGKYNSQKPDQNYFKFINSWGAKWGDNGFGYFPVEYVANVNFFRSSAYAVDLLKA